MPCKVTERLLAISATVSKGSDLAVDNVDDVDSDDDSHTSSESLCDVVKIEQLCRKTGNSKRHVPFS